MFQIYNVLPSPYPPWSKSLVLYYSLTFYMEMQQLNLTTSMSLSSSDKTLSEYLLLSLCQLVPGHYFGVCTVYHIQKQMQMCVDMHKQM